MDALSVEESVNDIRIAIVQAYMQCLYAADAVRINRSTAEASKAQRDRAEEMLRTGSISRVDFAQAPKPIFERRIPDSRSRLDTGQL